MILEHAKAAPSSMARILQCAFSRSLCEQYPQAPDDPKAMEGTAAHWVLERALREEPAPAEGALAPNGIPVTDEMLDGAEMFYDAVVLDFPGALAVAHIEERVDCFDLHPECWGTPDYWAFDDKTGILYLYDYKFGHRFVHPFENWQLLTYLAGILKRLGARASILRIEARIVQPRNYHKDGPIRSWSLSVKDVAHYAARISEAIYRSFQDAPQATTGPECDYCSGRHACSTLQEKALRAVEVSRRGIPVELTSEAAGSELRMIWDAIQTLEARATGLEASVTQAINSGKRIVGLGLEATVGREAWTVTVPEVLSLGEAMEINVAKPAVLTPKQAIKAGLPEDVVKAFSARKSGAVKLVLSNDRAVRQAFQQQE